MRLLLLTHAFNSLTQRLYTELAALGHELAVEFDINDRVTEEAVALFRPRLILAPYLRRAIPESVWRAHLCLIVHPGPPGDRGPSALDRAILDGEAGWGVTVLQAEAEMDAGPVWAQASFPMRAAKKSSLYRNEVTEAAVRAVLEALSRLPDYQSGRWLPARVALKPLRPLVTQAERAIDWATDGTERVIRKLHAADGFPGVRDQLFGQHCFLYQAQPYPAAGAPGAVLGRAGEGVVRATVDGAVWIGHARRPDAALPIKLPVALAFPEWAGLDELDTPSNPPCPPFGKGGDPSAAAGGVFPPPFTKGGAGGMPTPIRYHESGAVGFLHFDFYNGAMGSADCRALRAAYLAARARPTRVLVLMGGADFFSNGLDLNRIEAAVSPADASLANIEAMDDLCRAIIETDDRLTVAALQGNAGAGGAFLALAADRVWARDGVILNPHYKNMGNLYGSEYWTYLLPRRVGAAAATVMGHRLPLGVAEARALGLIDAHFGGGLEAFAAETARRAQALAAAPDLAVRIAAKRARRAADEAARPLAAYRADELDHMRRNFYGFDPSYHVARHHFVRKTPHSWTPRHLARHRELGWQVPEGE